MKIKEILDIIPHMTILYRDTEEGMMEVSPSKDLMSFQYVVFEEGREDKTRYAFSEREEFENIEVKSFTIDIDWFDICFYKD